VPINPSRLPRAAHGVLHGRSATKVPGARVNWAIKGGRRAAIERPVVAARLVTMRLAPKPLTAAAVMALPEEKKGNDSDQAEME
jgi:hypothetical protein